MQTFLSDIWTQVGPSVTAALTDIVKAVVGIAALYLIAHIRSLAGQQAIAQAVVTAAKDPTLVTGADKLASVKAALPNAAEAAIEVAVAQLVKPTIQVATARLGNVTPPVDPKLAQ